MTTKVSELFYSLQGEGLYTGVPSVFLRFFLCSLQCQGFGQKNPADESTWVQPWKTIDISKVSDLQDLPTEVYEYGCDSVYSWNAKFKHLQKTMTVDDIINWLIDNQLYEDVICGKVHLILTGGEPLMKNTQGFINELLKKLCVDGSKVMVTFETNGTVELSDDLRDTIQNRVHETVFSVSPKLLNVAGEKPEKAIKPNAVSTYNGVGNILFKYVMVNTEPAKKELFEVINKFESVLGPKPVYIMPEGPNKHRVVESRKAIAEFCMKHRFRFCDRLHTHLWDNKMGV